MLGDGYLSNRNKSKSSSQLIVTNVNPSYINHVSQMLAVENIDHTAKIRAIPGGFAGSRKASGVFTKFYKTFADEERRWYHTREDGTHHKIVPPDLALTRTSLLHWYLGDGYLVNLRGEPVRVQFCTDRYTDEEIVFLHEGLKRDLGLDIQIDWHRRRLRVPKRQLNEFFDLLPPCPPEIAGELGYKWAA